MIATASRAWALPGLMMGLPPAKCFTAAAPAGMGQMAHAAGSPHPVEQQYALSRGSSWDKRSIVLGACRPYDRRHAGTGWSVGDGSPERRKPARAALARVDNCPCGGHCCRGGGGSRGAHHLFLDAPRVIASTP